MCVAWRVRQPVATGGRAVPPGHTSHSEPNSEPNSKPNSKPTPPLAALTAARHLAAARLRLRLRATDATGDRGELPDDAGGLSPSTRPAPNPLAVGVSFLFHRRVSIRRVRCLSHSGRYSALLSRPVPSPPVPSRPLPFSQSPPPPHAYSVTRPPVLRSSRAPLILPPVALYVLRVFVVVWVAMWFGGGAVRVFYVL